MDVSGVEIVYVLHFITPEGRPYRQADHAGHYIGFCASGLPSRMGYHRRGHGSRLIKAVMDSGNDFVIALKVEAPRTAERQIKVNGSGAISLCPICRGDAQVIRFMDKGFYVRFRSVAMRRWYEARVQGAGNTSRQQTGSLRRALWMTPKASNPQSGTNTHLAAG